MANTPISPTQQDVNDTLLSALERSTEAQKVAIETAKALRPPPPPPPPPAS